MKYLNTPFGEVKIFIDDMEVSYDIVEKQANKKVCPDIVGRYHLGVEFVPDGKEHEIKCIIEDIIYSDKEIESGEMLECLSFYNKNNWKLSIGLEGEIGLLSDGSRYSEQYDYDVIYLEDGMAYVILEETKEEYFKFGVSWIDNVNNDNSRDVQTWYASDVTID